MSESSFPVSIPFLLIYSRIVSAIVIIFLVFICDDSYALRLTIAIFMIVAVITDIFDGIIARHMGISSDRLRLYDSNADQVFWIIALIAVFYLCFSFFKVHYLTILSIVILEIIAYVISVYRWRKPIATHSILAKFFTLSLMFFLFDLCIHSSSVWPYYICAILGVVSRLEMIGILLLLNKYTMDVPSILAVRKMNKGIPVRKSKIFNS